VLNGAATIGHTLKALTTQRPIPSEYEIIVVDNGSTDGTAQIVGAYPSVILLTASRRGPAAARNVGLRSARGDIVLHCDADTLPSRRWVAELAALFRDESIHIAAGKTLSFPPSTPVERYFERARLFDTEFDTNRPILPFAGGVNLAVRRSSALAIGGWTEEMVTAEDVDFCTRMLARFPGKIVVATAAVLFHRNRQTDAAFKNQAWTYGEGAADIYARHSNLVTWGFTQYARVATTLLARTFAPIMTRVRTWFGKATHSDVEFFAHQRIWTWWFWAGFMSFRRHGQYLSMRKR
jgi:glycosyltransferase involved in cell wall biosynthesis